ALGALLAANRPSHAQGSRLEQDRCGRREAQSPRLLGFSAQRPQTRPAPEPFAGMHTKLPAEAVARKRRRARWRLRTRPESQNRTPGAWAPRLGRANSYPHASAISRGI